MRLYASPVHTANDSRHWAMQLTIMILRLFGYVLRILICQWHEIMMKPNAKIAKERVAYGKLHHSCHRIDSMKVGDIVLLLVHHFSHSQQKRPR